MEIGDRVRVTNYPDSGNGRSPMGRTGVVVQTGLSTMNYLRVVIDDLPGPNRTEGWLFLRSEIELIPASENNKELWV